MSKHVKELRNLARFTETGERETALDAKADHMESIERQLRIAKRLMQVLRSEGHGHPELLVKDAEAAMRKAAKKVRK